MGNHDLVKIFNSRKKNPCSNSTFFQSNVYLEDWHTFTQIEREKWNELIDNAI